MFADGENSSAKEEIDKPLDDSVLAALGKSALKTQKREIKLYKELAGFYQGVMLRGLDDNERKELNEKWESRKEFGIPEINQALLRWLAKNNKATIARDRYRQEAQCEVGMALSLTVGMLSRLNGETESIEPDEFKQRLCDAALLQADAIFKQTESRKAFITPLFSDIRDQLERAETDNQFLYGVGLETEIKETKYVNSQTQVLHTLAESLKQSRGHFLGRTKSKSERGGPALSARGALPQKLQLKSKNDFRNNKVLYNRRQAEQRRQPYKGRNKQRN